MSRKKLTRAQYGKEPRINISLLKSARKSALQYKYDSEHYKEPTPAMEFGTAVHCAVFEPEKFLNTYVCYLGETRRGSEWEQFKREHENSIILKNDEYVKCLNIRNIVRTHELVSPYLTRGKSESTILWDDKTTGLKCKGRCDWRSSSIPAQLDLKTCRDISRFINDSARLGYHLQAAFYHDGAIADPEDGEDMPFIFVAVESEPPHDIAVFQLNNEALIIGRTEYTRLLELVKYCTTNNVWPGAYIGAQELIIPTWAGGSGDDLGLTFNGESIATE